MAYTKGDFTKTPWSTNQSYTQPSFLNSDDFLNDRRRKLYDVISLKREEELYLYNVNTEQQVVLRLIPNSLSESYSPRIVSVSPLGTVTPINFYVGGEGKTISFSFEMYEDFVSKDGNSLLNKIPFESGSIYKLVDAIKKMSEPTDSIGFLQDPIVYFQLGNQFVGKGHIQTSFDFKKPYRNGRYTYISCSMTFTFHEEFEDDPINLGDSFIAEVNQLDVSSNIIEGRGNLSIENFIKFSNEPNYFVSQIFENEKLKRFFNVIKLENEEQLNNYRRYNKNEYTIEMITDNSRFYFNEQDSNNLIEGRYGYTDNPYAVELLNSYKDLDKILTVLTFINIQDKIQALNTLLNKVQTFYSDAKARNFTYIEILPRITLTAAETIVEKSLFDRNGKETTSLRDFRSAYNFLTNNIVKLVRTYNSLYGAGD